MKIIEAAKKVLEANNSLETGALQAAIQGLKDAVEAHNAKIQANRDRKATLKVEQGAE